jgi:hypothetical protein
MGAAGGEVGAARAEWRWSWEAEAQLRLPFFFFPELMNIRSHLRFCIVSARPIGAGRESEERGLGGEGRLAEG